MHVSPVKTHRISPNSISLISIVDACIKDLSEGSIVAISSKIVSLCEGSVTPYDTSKKDELIIAAAQRYIPRSESAYNTIITVVHNSLMLASGMDESNSDNMLVSWPEDPLVTARAVHLFLRDKFQRTNIGVLIVDSTSRPLRIGTIGTSLAHWGFYELNDYRGKKDLFGREMTYSQANVAEMLANAAVLAMGEGAEQTPIAVISDVSFVQFDASRGDSCYRPTRDALGSDVYWPILKDANWRSGGDTNTSLGQ